MSGLRIAVIAVADVLCAATSPPRYRYPRNYPAWRAPDTTVLVTRCGELRTWVSRSGKQGIGVSVSASDGEPGCRVEVLHAELALAGRRVVSVALPAPVEMTEHGTHYLYVPFELDNEAAWNRGERHARLLLRLGIDGKAVELDLALEHHYDGPHRRIDRYAPIQPEPKLRAQ